MHLSPVSILSQLDPVHNHTSRFLRIHVNIILPSKPGPPYWSLSFRCPNLNPVHAWPVSHRCYMPRPSHSSRFHYPNDTGWVVQIIKLLIMLFSPIPCYLIPLRPKYSPQYPQHKCLPQCDRPSFTPIQNSRQNFSYAFPDLSIFG